MKPKNEAMKPDTAWDGNFYGLIKDENGDLGGGSRHKILVFLFDIPKPISYFVRPGIRVVHRLTCKTQEVDDQFSYSCDGFWLPAIILDGAKKKSDSWDENFAVLTKRMWRESDPSYH